MPDCPFCQIAIGKIPTFTVYEDDFSKAFLDINPGTKGQIVLIPKKHAQGIHTLSKSEIGKLFNAAKLIILGMTQSLNCEGANLVYSLGARAGQRSDHMLIYLIPRYNDDKVVIYWEPKQANKNELSTIAESLKKAIESIPVEVKASEPEVIVEEEKKSEEEVIEEKPRIPTY